MRANNPLVQFNSDYYKYPKTISEKIWGRNLNDWRFYKQAHVQNHKWLQEVKRLAKTEFHDYCYSLYYDPDYTDLLCSLIRLHGFYIEKFFYFEIHERITRKVAIEQPDLLTFQTLLSSAWGYESQINNDSDLIYRIKSHVYQQVLASLMGSEAFHENVKTWIDESSDFRECILCGKKFRIIDLPDWIYHGSSGQKNCCFQCLIVEHPVKKDLHKLISEFVNICGFIPTSNAHPLNYSFTSRIPEELFKAVMLSYAKMGGMDHVEMKFGSWFKSLVVTGVLPDGVLVTKRGIRCLAKDGHECHSLDEQRIDDWLTEHGIQHEREPGYPEHIKYNPGGLRRADWKVADTFIEYFGLIGDNKYEKKMNEKIALAELSGINLVSLFPSDINRLDERLSIFL